MKTPLGIKKMVQFNKTLRTVLPLIAIPLAACQNPALLGDGSPSFDLTSSSLQTGAFPKQFTCDGADTSPELAWSQPPPSTKSFALLVIDRDAPIGSFVHWIIYNLPADQRELPEGQPKIATLPNGSQQGQNDFDKIGFGGPCPPGKSAHRYVFNLYALDTKLTLPANPTRDQLANALRSHIQARGQLTATYHR
jgi:Raf kinase inhibitor-like YbhB/YbcL family protein